MLVRSLGADCCGIASSTAYGHWLKKSGSDDARGKNLTRTSTRVSGVPGGAGACFIKESHYA
jgi:hypothetical protein